MVSDGIGNTEKACISKHFLVSGVTCRCRIGSTPKRNVAGSTPVWDATNSAESLILQGFQRFFDLWLSISAEYELFSISHFLFDIILRLLRK